MLFRQGGVFAALIATALGFVCPSGQWHRSCLGASVTKEVESDSQGWHESWASNEYGWYILQCYTGQEKRIASQIVQMLEERPSLKECVAEIVVPYENVAGALGKKVTHKARIVYPGYVFCRIKLQHDIWLMLMEMPKVVNFIGTDVRGKVRPVALRSDEAERMLSIVARQNEMSSEIVGTYLIGDRVAVVDGTHAGERGVVRSVRNDQLIVRLLGVGSNVFDVPLEPKLVRKLEVEEIVREERQQQQQQQELEPRDVLSHDAQIQARRERVKARRESNAPKPAREEKQRKRSRWDVKAAVAARSDSPFDDDDDDDVRGHDTDASYLRSFLSDVDDEARPSTRRGLQKKNEDSDFLRRLLESDDEDKVLEDLAKQDTQRQQRGVLLTDDDLFNDEILSLQPKTSGSTTSPEDDAFLRELLESDMFSEDEQRSKATNPGDDDSFLLREFLRDDFDQREVVGRAAPEAKSQRAFVDDLASAEKALEDFARGGALKDDSFLHELGGFDDDLFSDDQDDRYLEDAKPSPARRRGDRGEMVFADDRRDFADALPTDGSDVDPSPGPRRDRDANDPAQPDDDFLLRHLIDNDDPFSASDDDDDDDDDFEKLLQVLDADQGDQDLLAFLDKHDKKKQQDRPPPSTPEPAATPPSVAAAMDYASLTVPDLKAELRARGLKVSGRKAELVARLEDSDAAPRSR
ncbi:hypothetical protein CTAYLR_001004 [Chrysophaeum taylorii]|uniref:SAP domain-containing protein n=1 Tax=Chrysophaeum taylorii TaxID=2483200 RepID=A0AAD7UFK8_9STRA|nr:hypothetical protein CTAYLR_001004 [Chrysophaeum taylorii]